MSLPFTVAEPWFFMFFSLFFFFIIFIRYQFHKPTFYIYPLASYLKKKNFNASSFYSLFFFSLRIISFLLLVFLIARPQIEYGKTNQNEDGIDIILDLDVSGSMDILVDSRSRFEIARSAALEFAKKRVHDSVGLVIFGKRSLLRAPLIFDKQVLKEIMDDINIQSLGQEIIDGTDINSSIVASCRALDGSKGKSKVVILLTDGISNVRPTNRSVSLEGAVKLASKAGVKVYTIAFGPFCDEQCLRYIAEKTGANFFQLRNFKGLDKIYDKINELEKKSHEVKLFPKYNDYFMPFLIFLIGLLFFELIMATFVWFIL